jgi:hypothetical protein
MVELDDLMAQVDIGDRLGTTKKAVNNWIARHEDFPPPLVKLGATPVYSWEAVKEWYISHFGIKKYRLQVRYAKEQS